MKYLLRVFVFHVFALWIVSEIFPPFSVDGSWQMVLMAGFVLAVLMILVKPALKILFIPINLITFGLLSWIVNVIVLYILTVLVPEVRITGWTFPGWESWGFAVPSAVLTYPVVLVLSSFLITLTSHFLHRISES